LLDQGEQFDVSVYDLAQRHDARDLVVKTLLTYLELEGVLQSTGPFYVEFKFQPQRPSAEIIAKYDPARAEFLRGLFRSAKKGKTWFALDADAAAKSLGEPRERIVAALNYLEEQGDLVVQATGVRLGFRRLRQPRERSVLAETLADRFLEREAHDIERVASVVALAEQEGCLTSHLLESFGEQRGPCGHCNRCAGSAAQPLATPRGESRTQIDVQLIRGLRAEAIAALRTPRQITRFLCGITSPASTRAKLRARPEFGQWSHLPFADVLSAVERA
jgi:ATP-dependent DNA helicase RecQ